MSANNGRGRPQSTHFLARDHDGSVRLRMRFSGEEASLFEEAAGSTPIMIWMHQALKSAAEREVQEARVEREAIPPPVD